MGAECFFAECVHDHDNKLKCPKSPLTFMDMREEKMVME